MMNTNFVLPLLIGVFVVMLFIGGADGRDELSALAGRTGLVLLIAANAYYPTKLIVEAIGVRREESELFFKKYLNAHMVVNLFAVIAVFLHGHYVGQRPTLLRLAFLALLIMGAQGFLMYRRMVSGEKNYSPMLQRQRIVFAIFLLLAILGHYTAP